MTLERVHSGGQSGCDQAGLRAAKALGYATGGLVPRGCRTEDGPAPWLVTDYGCRESRFDGYEHRTRANVRNTDATWIFCLETLDGGSHLTHAICVALGKPVVVTILSKHPEHDAAVAVTLRARLIAGDAEIRTLNVAGNRESKSPGIGARVEAILLEALKR